MAITEPYVLVLPEQVAEVFKAQSVMAGEFLSTHNADTLVTLRLVIFSVTDKMVQGDPALNSFHPRAARFREEFYEACGLKHSWTDGWRFPGERKIEQRRAEARRV
jgi:hypothetical protein